MRSTVVCLLGLITVSQLGCAGWQASATRTERFSTTPPTLGLLVAGRNGSVTVEAWDQEEVSVELLEKAYGVSDESAEAMLDEIDVTLKEVDGLLSIAAAYPPSFRGSIAYKIKAPANLNVEIKTGNGAVKVNGIAGSLVAKTSNGRVDVKDAMGPVAVSTSNGAVDVAVLVPTQVTANTSNGSITFSGSMLGGNNQLETSNGSVSVALFGEPTEITYKTSNGKVTVDGAKLEKRGTVVVGEMTGSEVAVANRVNVRTSNGSITIRSTDVAVGSQAAEQLIGE